MKMTDEQKAQAIKFHKENMEEMRKDMEQIDLKLGRNHPAATKMRQILDITEGMTDEDVIALSEVMNEIMEAESSFPQPNQ
jgi:hypothetical protein